tara:strand:+ start:443 stop:769 length:327 start_codon:yes stop_codon:yes gene_type:complete
MKLQLDWHTKYWKQLQEELEKIENKSIILDMFYEELKDLTAPYEYNLFKEIHEFQIKNNLSPRIIASMRTLAKFQGGNALVKKIGNEGGAILLKTGYEEYVKNLMVNK